MAEEAKWYVVHTYSGYENKVASNLEKTVENRQLQELIQEIRVPTEKVTEITEAGKRKEVERKIFPGYVIVKMVMTDESWYAVRNIRGCTGFVGPSSKPIPLTEDEVARLGIENKEVEVSYKVGDSVNIVDGPLEGFIGTVEEMDVEKNRVRVTVSMFGRETPVELELDQAEPGRSPERAAAPRKKQRQSSKAASGKASRFDVRGNAPVGGTAEIFLTAAPSSTTNFGGANKWLRRLRALSSFKSLPARQPRLRL